MSTLASLKRCPACGSFNRTTALGCPNAWHTIEVTTNEINVDVQSGNIISQTPSLAEVFELPPRSLDAGVETESILDPPSVRIIATFPEDPNDSDKPGVVEISWETNYPDDDTLIAVLNSLRNLP